MASSQFALLPIFARASAILLSGIGLVLYPEMPPLDISLVFYPRMSSQDQ
ncbi:uncharacterized protein G2W53_020581 [Senna tora]|uniref:Uncharacterized protein n=1 Tax=Senna tora TaxID=362788 RepID=A0A834WNX7_9FABA|nr:uncharacterized protein G2W53_020581 [Senna tora]